MICRQIELTINDADRSAALFIKGAYIDWHKNMGCVHVAIDSSRTAV